MTSTTDPTTPTPDLTALGDDALLSEFETAVGVVRQLTIEGASGTLWADWQDHREAVRTELLRRLTAAERPADGTVIGEIAAERQRQIEQEGWSAEHDDEWESGELARAAACYALGETHYWPWDWSWWKPKTRRRDLIRAAALIVAEIERLDRTALAASSAPADAALGQGEGD